MCEDEFLDLPKRMGGIFARPSRRHDTIRERPGVDPFRRGGRTDYRMYSIRIEGLQRNLDIFVSYAFD